MDEKIKITITILIVMAAIILTYSMFAESKVYIIMDLRNVSDDTIRNNIMQCGTDFAGSSGLVGKNITIFALEDDKCTALEGIRTIQSCLDESKGGILSILAPNKIIIVQSKMNTAYDSNTIIIKVGANYTLGTCNIKKISN